MLCAGMLGRPMNDTMLERRWRAPRGAKASRAAAGVLACCVLALLVGGCTAGTQENGAPGQPPRPTDAWQARPVSIRVYPSTRFAEEGADVLLEAGIELLDEMSDPVKGAGEFRLDLFALEGRARGPQLYLWRIPVYSLDEQRRFYDGITRSYLLRLRLDNAQVAQQPALLRVVFSPVASARLEAEATLKPMPRPPAAADPGAAE